MHLASTTRTLTNPRQQPQPHTSGHRLQHACLGKWKGHVTHRDHNEAKRRSRSFTGSSSKSFTGSRSYAKRRSGRRLKNQHQQGIKGRPPPPACRNTAIGARNPAPTNEGRNTASPSRPHPVPVSSHYRAPHSERQQRHQGDEHNSPQQRPQQRPNRAQHPTFFSPPRRPRHTWSRLASNESRFTPCK
ncbi:hypothetical protein KC19_VG310300 [Ceratodon purpureus]|uniref:Uncharacterized protein n=1 Tax=Ceratodon purpureus TaxID=3225 RepID=A0A8T0HWE7_CERPU|nr:hypothetical protein KC19_VG310300 [Ceratodon purpureus]